MHQAQAKTEPSKPLRKLNPQPKMGYRVTMTIAGAPGPLEFRRAVAQYDVTNENECGERDRSAGTFYRMTSSEPMAFTKVNDLVYEGTVYLDQIIDEDYYGRGVCHWEFTATLATLSASDDPKETKFGPSLNAKNLLTNRPETYYFWKGAYLEKSEGINLYSGQTDRSRINRRDDELFTITLIAKELRP